MDRRTRCLHRDLQDRRDFRARPGTQQVEGDGPRTGDAYDPVVRTHPDVGIMVPGDCQNFELRERGQRLDRREGVTFPEVDAMVGADP